MKTILCFTLTLITSVMLTLVPNIFAQAPSPQYVVRQIYFYPSDLPPPQNIDPTLDKLVGRVQEFYADEMERHGFGRKTFRLETDEFGEPVRHYVEGKFAKEHYTGNEIGKANEEISEQFDRSEHLIYLIFINRYEPIPNFSQVGGNASGGPFNGTANITLSNYENAPGYLYTRAWTTIAHELGHAFGLPHDFRDDHYIMSYGDAVLRDRLSSCTAEWLDVHRYFNTTHDSSNLVATIQMLDPVLVSSPNTIRLQFEIDSSAELHQAQLLTNSFTWLSNPFFDSTTVLDCKPINGSSTTIEFITTGLAPTTEYVTLHVIDEHGNFTGRRFPIDMTALLPDSEPVLIPDVNLAMAIRESLGLSPESVITELDMLGLGRLDATKKQITNLTGLQHATNLQRAFLNENQIVDLTPLTRLTQLRTLLVIRNKISDIRPISELTQLSEFWIWENDIADITPLVKLTNLTTLKIGHNRISDISPIAKLVNLRQLGLSSNDIDDIDPLAELAKIGYLSLAYNQVSDVRPLINYTNLGYLNLVGNPVKNRKPLLALLRKNPNADIYLKNFDEPLPVTLSHFRAEHTNAGVVLQWTTESEVDNAGFYIYRSQTKDGEFKVVNPQMIQGAGTTGERNEYTWTDTTAKPNVVYYYRIEDVSHAGVREQLATVRLDGLISAKGKFTITWAELKTPK